MLSEQQQRIMGYFIEEAKDHLNTIEQGLVNLQATITDSEMVHEVFRAAHSVKGGAAMLGLDSIQHTAHRLEDYFKVLKECPQVQVDQKLETLFLRAYDTLHELVTQLQGPFGLTSDKAQEAMTTVEPVFAELNQHLSLLVNQAGGAPPEDVDWLMPAVVTQSTRAVQPAIAAEESALYFIFQTEVPARLRDMLQLFKQSDTIDTRHQLQTLCRVLTQFGEQFQLANWCTLLDIAQRTIGNPDNNYRSLAPILIKDLKRSQEMILSGRIADVAASDELLDLLPLETFSLEDAEDEIADAIAIKADLADLLSTVSAEDNSEDDLIDSSMEWADLELDAPIASDLDEQLFEDSYDVEPQADEQLALSQELADLLPADAAIAEVTDDPELGLDFELLSSSNPSDEDLTSDLGLDFIDRLESEPLVAEMSERSGPDVGTAELDSLATLFESDIPNLDSTWSDEAASQFFVEKPSVTADSDIGEFHDLLHQDPADLAEDVALDEVDEEDLSGLLNAVALQTNHLSTTPASSIPSSPELQLALEEIANALPSDFELPESTSDEIAVFFTQQKAAGIVDGDATAHGEESDDRADNSTPSQNFDDLFSDDDISTLTLDEPLDETLEELDSSDLVTELLKPIDESASLLGFEIDAIDNFDGDRGNTSKTESEDLFDLVSATSESSDFTTGELSSEDIRNSILNWELSSVDSDETPDELDIEEILDEFSDSISKSINLTITNEFSAAALGNDIGELNLPSQDETSSEIDNWFEKEYSSDNNNDSIDLFNEDKKEDKKTDELIQLIELDRFNEGELELESNIDSNSIAADEEGNDEEECIVLTSIDSTAMAGDGIPEAAQEAVQEATTIDALSTKETLQNEFEQSLFNFRKDLEPAADVEAFLTKNDAETIEDDEVASFSFATSQLNEDALFEEDGAVEWTNSLFENLETDDINKNENAANTDIGVSALDTEVTNEASKNIEGSLEDFSDLESILETESSLEINTMSSGAAVEEDVFSDLEAMLEAEPEPSDNPTLAADDFADLEALLEGEAIVPTPTAFPPPATAVNGSVTLTADDREFDDLEALLQETDQTLGVGSSPVRNPANATTRRSTRRHVIADQTMRVSVKHLDNLNNLVGEMVVNRNSLEQTQERLRQFLDNLLYQVQQLNDVGQRMRDLYERSLLESSLLSSRRSYSLSQNSGFLAAQSNHATGASFDALEMDRFTGFHTLSQEMIELIVRVRESASDIDFVVEESDQITRNFRQITTQLQEGLTRSRMVPFAQTADRLPRGVRDNAIKYGKQAELTIEGRDTLIDKMIVEQLYDPMTHLVNNAIAHGIETSAERIAAGKSPVGRITIRAFHQGNQTVISVSDDGAGINTDSVKAKAVAKGLISFTEAQQMSCLEIYDLLFHHGFSTADKVDDLRGRGVGLDVVRNNLSEIRGGISIDSAVGKGTTFTIRLPLTLSISKALCCISNRARIAFAMDGVEDMLDVPKDGIHIDEQGRSCIQWRDALLPFQPLSDLLKYNRVLGRGSVYGGNQEEDTLSIVVLRSSGNYLALQVDQVLGEQEIVIKQLEGPVPKPIGIAGATVLGDGRIMPIADVLELIDLSQGRIRREASSALWETSGDHAAQDTAALKTDPTVLIVDDSITVRELLSMTFNKVGYRVEQARDGQEAWEKLRSGLPCDLVFCDIEMPRMDGLELLSRLQKDPNLGNIPIAMLTSRGADRHRQMAIQLGAKGYFTKPYLEEVLLDAAQRMLKGEILVSSAGN
jgi:chemotaxis protein histidine kinase CheA/ActR/RegA family two-component response regulator